MNEQEFFKDEIFEQKQELINGLPAQFLFWISDNENDNSFMPRHFHDYIEIIYAIEGTHKLLEGGSWREFSAGDLVLIDSGQVHGFKYGRGRHICLRFEREMLYFAKSKAIDVKNILFYFMSCTQGINIIKKSALEKLGIPELFMEIRDECSNGRYGYEVSVQIKINEIFLRFIRYWHESQLEETSSGQDGVPNQFSEILSYVSDHYDMPITSYEMAQRCNMSYSYFSRTFKKVMRKPFSEYLTYIRVNEAEKLLLTTDMTVTEIAYQVGFSSTSYFIQKFKSLKSVSPKQYKAQLKIVTK